MSSEEDTEAATSLTLDEWRTKIRKSADAIMQATDRPSRAGSIAGALTACSTGRGYAHGDVLYAPQSGPNILLTAKKAMAEEIARRLRKLDLPGVASIDVTPYGTADMAEVRITPIPRPQEPEPAPESNSAT